MIGRGNGNEADVILDSDQADAVLVDAPQPSEEEMISLYRTYRRVGGTVLETYEARLRELARDERRLASSDLG